MTSYDFRVDVEKTGDEAVLVVAGDVDLATSPIVMNKVEQLFRESITGLALDLRAVTFLDSSGLAVLLRAHTLSVEQGVTFTFAAVSREVRRVVKSTGVAEILGLQP